MNSKPGFHMRVGSLLCGGNLDRLERALLAITRVSMWFQPAGVAQLFAAQRATGKCTDALWRLLYLAIWHTLFVLRPESRPTQSEDPLAWIV